MSDLHHGIGQFVFQSKHDFLNPIIENLANNGASSFNYDHMSYLCY